jgi:hypothetical protein
MEADVMVLSVYPPDMIISARIDIRSHIMPADETNNSKSAVLNGPPYAHEREEVNSTQPA